ncbi:MAG: hypothetical protein ACO1SV_25100 [Fimbriimonas sp.]
MNTPNDEERAPPGFAAYPRASTGRKDPDPMPSDRWLALLRAACGVLFFVQAWLSPSVESQRIPAIVFEGAWLIVVFCVCYAAGLGYRVGFRLFTLFGVLYVFGIYSWWAGGSIGREGCLFEAALVYSLLYSVYAAFRAFGWLKPSVTPKTV